MFPFPMHLFVPFARLCVSPQNWDIYYALNSLCIFIYYGKKSHNPTFHDIICSMTTYWSRSWARPPYVNLHEAMHACSVAPMSVLHQTSRKKPRFSTSAWSEALFTCPLLFAVVVNRAMAAVGLHVDVHGSAGHSFFHCTPACHTAAEYCA